MVRNIVFSVLVAVLFFTDVTRAQNVHKLKVESATVFLSGVQMYCSANLSFTAGENEIVFTNVAADVNNQSLTVGASSGITVASVTLKNDYLTPENLSPKALSLRDSIETLNSKKQDLTNKVAVLAEEIALLQENRKVSGVNSGLSVAELQKMENCLDQKMKDESLLKKVNELIAKLSKQLNEEKTKNTQPSGQLVVKFIANSSMNGDVYISYVSKNAGWTPVYDIKAESINEPLKLYYKANVFQNTGVKWDKVHLVLSTGNPNASAQAPALSPWYLSFYSPKPYYNSVTTAAPPATMHAYKKALVEGAKEEDKAVDYNGVADFVNVDNTGINTSFDIQLPYTIPSDNQKHLVSIQKYDVPAAYRYFTVPKSDNDVFLEALATNWEDLNLLAGPTNVFYEGTYVGQGYLDMKNVKDSMVFSLGRDKKIVTKRERDKKLRSVKTIGTNVREKFAYTITIRNTRKESINLVVQDQLPVSNDKDIQLEDTDTGWSEYDDKTGILKWTLNMKPNETQNLTFGFTVKYPKDKTVENLPK
jgi:uncharacterized protein (TIGR02231 family)